MYTGLYVFGELLESECLQNLSETEYAPHLKLLEIYTYGTYTDYKSEYFVQSNCSLHSN